VTAAEHREAVGKATAALLTELAFMVPEGTNMWVHPIAQKLVEFRNALMARSYAEGLHDGKFQALRRP
jgi:hypothetical protein